MERTGAAAEQGRALWVGLLGVIVESCSAKGSLWLHGFMPEGLEMWPGHTLGHHPLISAAPSFCSVEVHLEEKMSGARLCHAVLMAPA